MNNTPNSIREYITLTSFIVLTKKDLLFSLSLSLNYNKWLINNFLPHPPGPLQVLVHCCLLWVKSQMKAPYMYPATLTKAPLCVASFVLNYKLLFESQAPLWVASSYFELQAPILSYKLLYCAAFSPLCCRFPFELQAPLLSCELLLWVASFSFELQAALLSCKLLSELHTIEGGWF